MNPIEYAWALLKGIEDKVPPYKDWPTDDWPFYTDTPESDEYAKFLGEDWGIDHAALGSDGQKPGMTPNEPRKENPVDIDAFRMQKPEMGILLNQIAEELGRRGGFMEKPSEPTSGDNPMFRHTRAEMLAAQKQIEDEQARRKTNREARRTIAEKAKELPDYE